MLTLVITLDIRELIHIEVDMRKYTATIPNRNLDRSILLVYGFVNLSHQLYKSSISKVNKA